MKTVFFDIDTQFDFLYPAGALYVPGSEDIVPVLGALTRFAAARGIQVLSTVDAHTENDAEFKIWKPHCVVGTIAQQKSTATKLPESAKQIIIEKQALDVFSNLELRPLLQAIAAERYVVYGVVTELCVRCAAVGLLETGARVEIVTNAVKALSSADERSFIDQFQASGGFLTTSATVVSA